MRPEQRTTDLAVRVTRREAERVVIAAARKLASTQRERYDHDGMFRYVLEQRLDRLRRAVRDLDRTVRQEDPEEEV